MATALDVIGDALKLLGIRAAESPVTDVEAEDGLVSLNDMLNEWVADGLCVDFETVEDVSDELCLDDEVLGAVKSNLAIYIAPEYSRTVTDALIARARKGKKVARIVCGVGELSFPDTLPVGSGNEYPASGTDGDSAGNFRDRRFYPANVDKCS